jgi:hypothetical protein
MYNKLCNKKYELLFNVSYLHKGQGSPNEFSILSSCARSMVSSSIFHPFCNDKNNSNSFHKLQGYFKFIYKKIIDSYIVGLLGFIISNDICNKEIIHQLLI